MDLKNHKYPILLYCTQGNVITSEELGTLKTQRQLDTPKRLAEGLTGLKKGLAKSLDG